MEGIVKVNKSQQGQAMNPPRDRLKRGSGEAKSFPEDLGNWVRQTHDFKRRPDLVTQPSRRFLSHRFGWTPKAEFMESVVTFLRFR